jgi:hypothetical protein
LNAFEKEKQAAIAIAQANVREQLSKTQESQASALAEALQKIKTIEMEKKLAVEQSTNKLAQEIEKLKGELNNQALIRESDKNELIAKHNLTMQEHLATIERLKDHKAKLSVKMLGETLEQHCAIEFDRIRSAAFPRAYFEKDNDARNGSKGDFIFRDYDESGLEFISVMFEMKNESDTSSTKKKNEDFFNTANYNEAKFVITSSEIDPEDNTYYNVKGNLTIKGITNEIEFPASVVKDADKYKIATSFDFANTSSTSQYDGITFQKANCRY